MSPTYEHVDASVKPTMSYSAVVFPEDISYGSEGGPGYKTTVVELDSGQELRYARWASPRRRYDVSYGIKSLAQLSTVLDFYHNAYGNLVSFLYKDFLDFTTATNHRATPAGTDVLIGVGDGATTAFQMLADYNGISRVITKPKAGTIVADVNGSATALFTVDKSTGFITFSSAPGVGHNIKIGCEFYTQVRFDVDGELMLSYDSYAEGSIQGIELVEVLSDVPHPESYDFGSASSTSINQEFSIEVSDGRFQRLNPTASGVIGNLPPAAELELGGPHFILENYGSFDMDLYDGTINVGTLAVGEFGTLLVYASGSDNRYALGT